MRITVTRTSQYGVQTAEYDGWFNYSRSYRGPQPMQEGGVYEVETETTDQGRTFIQTARQVGQASAAAQHGTYDAAERNLAIIAESCIASAATLIAAWLRSDHSAEQPVSPEQARNEVMITADYFFNFVKHHSHPPTAAPSPAPAVQAPSKRDDAKADDLPF